MSRRTRAGHVKSALYEITKKLVAEGTYSTHLAVMELRRNHDKAIKADADDVRDVGLKVLAGRVRANRSGDPLQSDLLRQAGLKEFEELVILDNGKRTRKTFNTLDMTVADFNTQAPIRNAEKNTVSSAQRLRQIMEEMRAAGYQWTIREYLER